MCELMARVMPLCGLEDPSSWPNSCHLDRFSSDDGLAWNASDEDLFKGTVQSCRVITLCLGGCRDFELRHTGNTKKGNVVCRFKVEGGDIYTMEGMAQAHYEHRISSQGGARLSLTWRWIVAHEGRCRPS